ncbi:uncharacterized protein LOC116135380 [Pistacia vera]|uniref:uncharacterized protein LOC116135380 n=1 Tax=Pistacia vera TaxID=55513 RepID=UPI0012638A07|nr:uncharacterized protein LOC116135380 [Pistacia vera]XP_031276936.1 uncharacterized protein LOC116135380 [Pistacia vera]
MEMEETLKILNSSLSTIKWRLKSAAKLRLEIDILALCTGMRPVIMVDYGGKMPELQEYLCALLKLCQKESPVFEDLRVMIIEDMIYLINVKELAEHVSSSLISEAELQFVDLEQDPPKMITITENSSVGMQLISVQKLFLSFFPLDKMNNDVALCNRIDDKSKSQSSDKPVASQSSEVIDLSNCLHDTQVTVPTLNGWLLGYPVVYLFGIDHIADAIYNLSTKSLRIFRIVVSRNGPPNKGSLPEELMSFSVPYDLSMGGSKEPWAEMFLSKMQSKWGKCKQTWRTLKMEVSECFPQAIAL